MEPKLHCLGPTSKKSHLKRNFLFYEIYFLFSDTEPVLIVMFFHTWPCRANQRVINRATTFGPGPFRSPRAGCSCCSSWALLDLLWWELLFIYFWLSSAALSQAPCVDKQKVRLHFCNSSSTITRCIVFFGPWAQWRNSSPARDISVGIVWIEWDTNLGVLVWVSLQCL